jgi:hypothetical protein
MDQIWQQSPDGRAIAIEVPHDRNAEALEGSRDEPTVVALEPFVAGCLSTLPERPHASRERLGFFLFVLGAADRFWAREGLDDSRFPRYAESLLQRLGLRPETAATLAPDVSLLPTQGPVAEAMAEGGETLDEWLATRDSNVPLRIKELLPRWSRMDWSASTSTTRDG